MVRKRILLVDDSIIFRESIKQILESQEYRVLTAENGRSGLEIVESNLQKFDLIILDYSMPGMSGLELLKQIRAYNDFKSIPILMLTESGDRDVVFSAIKQGATKYLLKHSLDYSELVNIVTKLIYEEEDLPIVLCKNERKQNTENDIIENHNDDLEGCELKENEPKEREDFSSDRVIPNITRYLKKYSIPNSTHEILNLLENTNSDGSLLCNLINGDPILAARILELANTATYKRGSNFLTLNDAITMIGIAAIKKLVLNDCIRTFKNNSLEQSEYFKYIKHSHAISIIILNISRSGEISALGQLAGLLHDITEIIISDLFPEQFRNAVEKCKKVNLPFSDVISNELELSYSDIVKVVIRHLNIPLKLGEIITSCNGRLSNKYNTILPILNSINVAHSITNALGYCTISNDLIDVFPKDQIESFSDNLDENYLPGSEVKSEIENWLSILNIKDNSQKAETNNKDSILYVKDTLFSNYDAIYVLLKENYKNVDLINTDSLEIKIDLKSYTMIVLSISSQNETTENFINSIPEGLPIIVFSKNTNFIDKSEDSFSDKYLNFNLPISRNLILEILNSKTGTNR